MEMQEMNQINKRHLQCLQCMYRSETLSHQHLMDGSYYAHSWAR